MSQSTQNTQISTPSIGISSQEFWQTNFTDAIGTIVVVFSIIVSAISVSYKLGGEVEKVYNLNKRQDEKMEGFEQSLIKIKDQLDKQERARIDGDNKLMRYLQDHIGNTQNGFGSLQGQVKQISGKLNRLVRALREKKVIDHRDFDSRDHDDDII